MKREALIRELRRLAREQNVFFEINTRERNGSHYRIYFGEKSTILKSGEITPMIAKLIKKQLGLS